MSRSLQIALNTMDETVCDLIHDADHLMMNHELTEKGISRIRRIRRMLYDIEFALEEMIE